MFVHIASVSLRVCTYACVLCERIITYIPDVKVLGSNELPKLDREKNIMTKLLSDACTHVK